MFKIEKYKKIQQNLFEYFKKNKHKGLDWSSVKYSDKYLNYIYSENKIVRRVKASLVSRGFEFFGKDVLFLFQPLERIYFTKAICLYLTSVLEINNKILEEHKWLLDVLESKRISNSNLFAHDISYKMKGANITTQTPNLVTTYFVAELYFNIFILNSNEKFKNKFKEIVEELLLKIPYLETSETEICFQYTSVSNYYVHNANLLYCELLVKYNFLFPKEDKFNSNNNLIKKSLAYSINDFKETGSYYYAGKETRNKSIDNYHTGYLLRSLYEINKYADFSGLNLEIDKLLQFYMNTFILKGKYTYLFEKNKVSAHGLAESMIVYSIFNEKFDEKTNETYLKKIDNSINLLYDGDKFYNKSFTFLGYSIKKDKMDYIRWSQAWMLLGVSKILKAKL